MTYRNEGSTVPEVGRHPWLTRNNDEAARDGWRAFGDGPGLARFVWDNSRFEGAPRADGQATPRTWQTDTTGCRVPGAVRYAGQFACPPRISDGFYFVLCTSRRSDANRSDAMVRLTLNGEIVVAHEPPAPPVCASANWCDPHGDQHWVEFLSREITIAPGEKLPIVIEYAIPVGGNYFAVKLCNNRISPDYRFAEILPPDLCYPDTAPTGG